MPCLADNIIKELKRTSVINLLKNAKTHRDKIVILENFLNKYNITKCSLSELDTYESDFLFYKLQRKEGIFFEICDYFGMTYRNKEFIQYCYYFNKEVLCAGIKKSCPHYTTKKLK